MTLTDEQKKAYVADPQGCPWCHSDDFDVYGIEDSPISLPMSCNSCGKGWKEIYELTTIVEDKDKAGG